MRSIEQMTGYATGGQQGRAVETPVSLEDRFRGAIQGSETSADVSDAPEPDPVRAWACRMFYDEFLRAMMTDDEEKLGPKPEPWDS